jgi:hypothetical protein
MGRARELAQGTKPGGDLATPLTKDVVDLGAAALAEKLGGKIGGESEAEATPKQPGPVKQLLRGEKVSQEPAQQALRTGAKAAGGQGTNASLRTVLEEPIDRIGGEAKSIYRQIEDAAGTDIKGLREKLGNVEYQIRQLTSTEEDVTKEAALEKSRTALEDKIAEAKQAAVKAGVDPKALEQADAKFTQASALQDLQSRVFKNTNVISGNQALGAEESINVNSAVKALQKLADDTRYGTSRLEQALGKEGAQGLLRDMYSAQKSGMQAIRARALVAKVAKWAAYGGGALAGGRPCCALDARVI